MSALKIVPFNSDGASGDNIFAPEISFDYHEGMTLAELQTMSNEHFMKEWGYDTAEEFIEDNEGSVPVNGWIISDEHYQMITDVIVMCGGDSAAYAVNNTMMLQIERASTLLVK